MEEYDQGFGSILYSTKLPALDAPALLTVNEPHDFVQVFIDGKYIGKMDRRLGEKTLTIPATKAGARLDILVEAMGRINFGRAIKDFKGITDNVTVTIDRNGYPFTTELRNWDVYNLPDELAFYQGMDFKPLENTTAENGHLPAGCYRATFNVKKPGDTFINMESWGKGLVYVNGHALGRFWEIGPQQTLYLPGCWLKKGENEILVFDIVGPKAARSEGLATPVIDKLQTPKPLTHREEGQNLDLSGEKALMSGSFAPGNGWQKVSFPPKPPADMSPLNSSTLSTVATTPLSLNSTCSMPTATVCPANPGLSPMPMPKTLPTAIVPPIKSTTSRNQPSGRPEPTPNTPTRW